MPLTGTPRDLNLFTPVQLRRNERQRAQVSLTQGCREGALICADGELIFASVGQLTGEDAVHELLTWEDAAFRVDPHPAAVERNINGAWTGLLLDGARRADEARATKAGRLESSLRSMKGAHGLRAAIIVSSLGQLRASVMEAGASDAAALVSVLAGRIDAIERPLNGGAFKEALFSGPTETVWIARKNDTHLAGWLEGRDALASLKALLPLLLMSEHADGAERLAAGSALSY